MEYKVTVIIPTYKRNETLHTRCLPSIFRQTYKSWELIVVNDGGAIINNIKDATVINLAENHGKSYCVNTAIKQAKGEYIVVVDDDNELHPEFLEKTIKAIEQESAKRIGFGHTPFDAVNTGRMVKHRGFDDYAPPFFQIGYGFSAIDWGWLIRKSVFDKIQYDENLFGDEDADFGIQFFKQFSAFALNQPLQTAYAYDNDGVCYPTEKRLGSLIRFYEKNHKEYAQAGPKDHAFINRFVARNLYLGGKKKEAIKYFWKAFVAWPNGRTMTHFLVSLINYKAYYQLMRLEERYYSNKRLKNYGIK